MATNGFNIFDYVDEFKKAGMPHEQADLLARAFHSLASESAASKQDLEVTKLELKRDIKELDGKIENVRVELKRDIKELDIKIETIHARLQEKIEDVRTGLKKDMAIIMGSYSFLILGTLVTLAKFGLLTPTP